MRREVPLVICFLFGALFIADYFISNPTFDQIAHIINQWAIIVMSFAYVLGVANIARINTGLIKRKEKDWGFKLVLLFGLLFMVIVGIGWGVTEGTVFYWVYMNAYYPMQATMFALLAFFIASAAFRAFRIRSWEAGLLAITAIAVMIGRVPIGEAVWKNFPSFTEWIMDVPQMAAKRAIMMGAALGAISTGLKVLTGLERTYLGGD